MRFRYRIGSSATGQSRLRRLSELDTGDAAAIAFTRNANTGRRMLVLGLVDGVRIQIESRDRNGDLIIAADGDRFHVRARHADSIWVDAD